MADEFGTAMGQTMVSGVRLFQAAQKYSYEVGYTGDYGKPARDLLAVGEILNQQWNELPPREQERRKYELLSQMVADGAIGVAGMRAVGKAGKFTEVLDTLAEQACKSGRRSAKASSGAAREIGIVIEDLMKPRVHAESVLRASIRKDVVAEFNMPELPPELKELQYQKTTSELLAAMGRKGRTFSIAREGSEDLRRLEQAGAQGGALGDHITIRENARKITALEEFLHGTQRRLRSFDDIPDQIAEVHVKDFMIRHARMLGLDRNDLKALDWLKSDAVEKADKAGFTWKE
ncbi:hypothetical protein KA344_08530 [bacterium]|nr:hypothetical protein [bacterium]